MDHQALKVDSPKGFPCPAQVTRNPWDDQRRGMGNLPQGRFMLSAWRMSLGATSGALGWVGEATHHWKPGDRTSVTSQESLLRTKGLLQPQPWHSTSLRSFSSPQGCRPHEGHHGEMFLDVQCDTCLCQNTCHFFCGPLTCGPGSPPARESQMLYFPLPSPRCLLQGRSSGFLPNLSGGHPVGRQSKKHPAEVIPRFHLYI